MRILRELTPEITNDAVVARNVRANNLECVVTLVRGCSKESAHAALTAMSAGGAIANEACPRPDEDHTVSQVGGSQPGKPQRKLPEFTSVPQKSLKWARRGGWLVVKVKTKYLLRGDVGQFGWVCLHAAPIEVGWFIPHPNPKAINIPNAD